MNGKISKEEAKVIQIQKFIETENNPIINKLYLQFEEFWKLSSKEIKYLQITKEINDDNFKDEIKKEDIIDFCLTGKENYNLMIPILIEHSINLHNELIKSPFLKSIFQDSQHNQNNENIENNENIQGFKESILHFPKILNSDFIKIIKFNIQEFQEFINYNNLIQKLDYIEEFIRKKLNYLKETNIFKIEIETFNYYGKQIEIKKEFLEIEIKWEQEELYEYQWKQIKEELERNNLFATFEKLIEYVILGCQNIKNENENKFSKLKDLPIIEFIKTKLEFQFKFEFKNLEDIENDLPAFKRFAKMKHLLFIHKQFKDDFENVLENLDKKFKWEMTSFQISLLENSLEKITKNIPIFDFICVLKDFIRKLKGNLNNNYPFKKLFLFSIKDKTTIIYKEIEENFDNDEGILLGNSSHVYQFCSDIFNGRN
ncbi:hypothetical protein M0811_12889 [Anaeramoeba ignava]|uniref:Uncharacterized protein n=1 Tax=Anaeramoeba ignava TaxID=1746090 RepID=A0A9Q0R654_ANAIG|nr:hypothetical protein M0811_12889 [Anaeramoeba ignava]